MHARSPDEDPLAVPVVLVDDPDRRVPELTMDVTVSLSG